MIFYLPIVVNKIAKETNFIQRNRQLSAMEFLKLLFSNRANVAEKSLTELCLELFEDGVSISKQGLNKKFNGNTVAFLKEIFMILFAEQMKLSVKKTKINSTLDFNAIRILDGTSIKLSPTLRKFYPGTVGAGVKIQLEFDFLTGKFMYVEIQAGKAGDSGPGMQRLESLQKGDLVLQDLGYFQYQLFKTIDEKEAFYVSRARADTMFYVDSPNPRYHRNGEVMMKYAHERLYLEDELKTMKRGETREYPKVYLGKHARYPTRLIVYRLSSEDEKRQLHRIKRRKQTKPGKIKKKSYAVSGITTFITNLPPKVSPTEVVELYRYRWQIELIFKSWKSDMKVNYYRRMKKERWESHFYAELILLLLSLLITYQLRVYFKEEKDLILSEQITLNEVSKKIWKFWQARDELKWFRHFQHLVEALIKYGLKNLKKSSIGLTQI